MEILLESNYKDMNLSKFLTSTKLGLPPNILEFSSDGCLYKVTSPKLEIAIYLCILSSTIQWCYPKYAYCLCKFFMMKF